MKDRYPYDDVPKAPTLEEVAVEKVDHHIFRLLRARPAGTAAMMAISGENEEAEISF